LDDPFDDDTADPDLPLDQQVDLFRKIARRNEDQKRIAGRKIYARLNRKKVLDRPLLRKFLLGFNAYDTEYEYVRFTGDQAHHAASFRVAMSTRTRRMRKFGRAYCPEWLIWEKREGMRFANVAGLRVPQQLACKPLADLEFAPDTVIKPPTAQHGIGVYLIFDQDRIGDAVRGDFFAGYDELTRRMQEDLDSGHIPEDNWIVETLARNAQDPHGCASDWKFYCFYGEVALITHSRRFPEMEDVWFGPDGQVKDLGFDVGRRKLDVPEIKPEVIEMAKQISLTVPAPFLRVDLLDADGGPMVGEFTPRPFFWRRFGRKLDLEMGDAFIAAEARLQADLLAGKDFAIWKEFVKNTPQPHEGIKS
jgi:hypothetical protein